MMIRNLLLTALAISVLSACAPASDEGGGNENTQSSNMSPTVEAGSSQTVQVNTSIKLFGSATDSDGTVESYQWTEGKKVLSSNATFSYRSDIEGVHTLTLTATDNEGATGQDSVTVTVVTTPVPNQAPTANAGNDQTVEVNKPVTLNGRATDSDGTVASYQWTEGTEKLSTNASFSYHSDIEGVHTLTLTATDNEGATGKDSVNVEVTKAGVNTSLPSTYAGKDRTIQAGERITLTGTYSGVKDARIYQWKEGADILGSAITQEYSSKVLGEHSLLFQVKDTGGKVTKDTVIITVVASTNQPPVADAGADQTLYAYETVTLIGQVSDRDNNVESFQWTENGTVISSKLEFKYSPVTVGKHTLKLSVTDSFGETASDTVIIDALAGGSQSSVFLNPAYLIQKDLNIAARDITSLSAKITKTGDIRHERFDYFKGDNAKIVKKGGQLVLTNNSFNVYESLLAKYTKNGKEIYVVVDFTPSIQPFSNNTINSLEHGDKLQIVSTANMFNGSIQFNAREGCEPVSASKKGDKLCMPTAAEQETYLTGLSHLSHFYNSVDLMPIYQAWAFKGSYKREDYEGTVKNFDMTTFKKSCLDFEQCRAANNIDDFIYKNLFAISVPNHDTTIKATHNPSVLGWGDGAEPDLFGKFHSQGFSSISINQIKFTNGFYMALHHEMMHGYGFSHTSSITYGFSDALSKAILDFYDYKKRNVSKVPEYIFQTKTIDDKKLLVTLYSTTGNTRNESVKVEFLGAQDNVVKVTSIGNNQFEIELKRALATRIFLRVYGADSEEVMSQLLYPVDFRAKKEQLIHNGEPYFMIENHEWKFIRDYAVLERRIMNEGSLIEMCRGWFGIDAELATGSLLELLSTTYASNVADAVSPIFVGKQFESDGRYDLKKYYNLEGVWKEREARRNIIDSNGNILCKEYIE